MNIAGFIEEQYLVERQQESFMQQMVFGTIPLFKTKAQISEEETLERRRRKGLHAIKLNTDVVSVSYETALKMNALF